MPDWKKIKAEYIRGVSYRILADKYGVSFSTIQKRGAQEKWTDLRKKSSRKADEKIVDAVASQEAKRAEQFKRISDKLLMKIESGIDNGRLISTARAIHDLTDALKTLREINDLKSELDVQEQMARIDKLRKDAEKDDANTNGAACGVVLMPAILPVPEGESDV